MLDKAQKSLENHSNRNDITWYAIISVYGQHGQSHDAPNSFQMNAKFRVYHQMLLSLFALKKAYGSMGAIDKGKQIHDEVVKRKSRSTSA